MATSSRRITNPQALGGHKRNSHSYIITWPNHCSNVYYINSKIHSPHLSVSCYYRSNGDMRIGWLIIIVTHKIKEKGTWHTQLIYYFAWESFWITFVSIITHTSVTIVMAFFVLITHTTTGSAMFTDVETASGKSRWCELVLTLHWCLMQIYISRRLRTGFLMAASFARNCTKIWLNDPQEIAVENTDVGKELCVGQGKSWQKNNAKFIPLKRGGVWRARTGSTSLRWLWPKSCLLTL